MTLLRAHGLARPLAPDAGARLLRLRDEHQSPHPPPQGNVPSARARLVAKFARLTRQEEKHGLLDETATIGTRRGGKGGWRSGDLRFAGIGWYGGGGQRAKKWNHEIITLAPKKLIRTRRASEGSASEPSLARRVSMC